LLGQRLIRKADFHLGQNVTAFARVKCKVLDPSTTKRNSLAIEKRQVSFYATLDGGLGYFLPISERTYRRLSMLQNVLNSYLPHRAALNPKAFRYFKKIKSRVLYINHDYVYKPIDSYDFILVEL